VSARIFAAADVFEMTRAMYPAEPAEAWIRRPLSAPPFTGRTPLVTMTAGVTAMAGVRAYLDGLAWG
jgi:hypothetical protein